MMELTSRQRKLLEKFAHPLQPVVIVGQNGVTPALTAKTAESLAVHELIKVKFNDFKDEKRELSERLSADCGATLVRLIGNVAILYRPAEKPEDQKYTI
ncbi:MAG: YhbY family RNA-binding protein [Treponemataceae bacterium]|nr:YhbY family RNA-binding protein [Treponemataceae bacterium]